MFSRMLDAVDSLSTHSIPRMAALAPVVPPRILNLRARMAFKESIAWAGSRSAYYRTKFAAHRIDATRIRSIGDLGDFYTWPEDVQNDPDQFLCAPPQLVFETSGTTGTPKRAYFSYAEIERLSRYEACALYYQGVRSDDRILCTFDQGFWVTGPVTEATFRHLNVFGSVVGKMPTEEALRRIRNDRYTVLLTDPTWLVTLTDTARHAGSTPQLKFILCGGDRLSDRTRNDAQKVWGCPVLQGYGTTETGGVIAGECMERDGMHIDEFNLMVEIVEKDSDGFGEIVVTTLSRRVMPLIRYRTRDVARMIETACRCGSTIRRISTLKARRDEMVVMGAGNIYPLMLEKLVEPIPNWPGVWQVVVFQHDGHDVLEFRIARNGAALASADQLRHSVEDQIRLQQPGMWSNLQCSMYRIGVAAVPAERFVATRKVRRLIDER